jgi:hypothetical protein
MTTTLQSPAFFATATGGRKHLAQCPHLVGASTTRPLAAGEELEVCDWCSKELSGFGRTYFDDLDTALAAFKAPLENRRLIKDALRDVEHDQIWMPYSSSYVALGFGGRGVAWAGKTYVVPEPGTSIELPGFVDATRTPKNKAADRWGDICLRCFHRRSVTGACECD